MTAFKRYLGVPIGCRVKITDNSGAKIGQIIGVFKKGARRRSLRNANIGDLVLLAIKKGKPELKGTMARAVIARTIKGFYRKTEGIRVSFEDNAAILVSDEMVAKGSSIKGVLPRELMIMRPTITALGATVV